jgi:hypothetical protein
MRIASSSRSVPIASALAVYSAASAHLHMALGREIIDLGRPDLLDYPDQAGAVGEVAVVELEADVGLVEVAVEVVDPPGVERRGAPLYPVDDVALVEQQLGEIGAVLAGDAGN